MLYFQTSSRLSQCFAVRRPSHSSSVESYRVRRMNSTASRNQRNQNLSSRGGSESSNPARVEASSDSQKSQRSVLSMMRAFRSTKDSKKSSKLSKSAKDDKSGSGKKEKVDDSSGKRSTPSVARSSSSSSSSSQGGWEDLADNEGSLDPTRDSTKSPDSMDGRTCQPGSYQNIEPAFVRRRIRKLAGVRYTWLCTVIRDYETSLEVLSVRFLHRQKKILLICHCSLLVGGWVLHAQPSFLVCNWCGMTALVHELLINLSC